MNINLANENHWKKSYENRVFSKATNLSLRKWAHSYIPENQNGRCIEIGCYPGSYQHIFGDLGYELNGIDWIDGTEADLPEWQKNENYKVGEYFKANFLTFDFQNRKYDLVYSLGFVEHFIDWKSVLKKHCELVKPNGYLLIEVPNFRGFVQRLLHYFLDRENYNRHNVKSMDPDKWEIVLKNNGFSVIEKSYFDGWDYWVEDQDRNWLQEYLLRVLWRNRELMKKVLSFNSRHFSPVCGIVAKKNDE